MNRLELPETTVFYLGTLLSAVSFFGLIGLGLALVLQIFIVSTNYQTCVVLPNGLTIGHESWIAPGKHYWQPEVVLKSPDKRTLIEGDIGPFYFSATTVYGRVWNVEDGYEIAYRHDAGLVRRDENPDLYSRLVAEAGPLLEEGKRMHNSNLQYAHEYLKNSRNYGQSWCGLSFLPHLVSDG